jgi:hypothetical protein
MSLWWKKYDWNKKQPSILVANPSELQNTNNNQNPRQKKKVQPAMFSMVIMQGGAPKIAKLVYNLQLITRTCGKTHIHVYICIYVYT